MSADLSSLRAQIEGLPTFVFGVSVSRETYVRLDDVLTLLAGVPAQKLPRPCAEGWESADPGASAFSPNPCVRCGWSQEDHENGEAQGDVERLKNNLREAHVEIARLQGAALSPHQETPESWTCFHCGETFTTYGSARDHFGATLECEPGCLIDRVALEVGGTPERGRGLQMALRKAEAEILRLQHVVETSDHQAEIAVGETCELKRRLANAYKPGVTIEQIADRIHGNTPTHGAFVMGCEEWPCSLIGVQHRFTAPSATEIERGADASECVICGNDPTAEHLAESAVVVPVGRQDDKP